jgi:thiamine biosynthesis lipoprotein
MSQSAGTSIPPDARAATLARVGSIFAGRFEAMASPCEVLIDTDDESLAEALLGVAEREARRVDAKFSRYRDGNIVHRINHSKGRPVPVDEETEALLGYAATCHRMSHGMFDITSGALRRIWKFDGGDQVPSEALVRDVLRHVGWDRIVYEDSTIRMPAGMEIDLGGIGKEYAVDRAAALIQARTSAPFLVNFGGDLIAAGPCRGERPWRVGIEDPERPGEAALYRIDISMGALATSGDARRFVLWKGKRLGHILNPRTGWPVENAPRSVTVLGQTCIEAGTLSTLACLQGARARDFLREQGAPFWIV